MRIDIMINNCKLVKNGKIYLPASSQQQHQSQHYQYTALKSQLRIFVEGILNFGTVDTKDQIDRIVKIMIEKQLDRSQLKQLWNDILKIEVKKYANRINSLTKVSKESELTKIGDSARQKVSELCQNISSVMIKLSNQQKWCLCFQTKCNNRYDPEYTYKTAQKYLISNMKHELYNHKNNLRQLSPLGQQQMINFFNMENDQRCNVFSLQCLDKQNISVLPIGQQFEIEEKQSIDQHLMHLKIDDFNRKQCFFDYNWIQKVSIKYQIQKL